MIDGHFPIPRSPKESSDDYRQLINIVDGLVRIGLFDVAITGAHNALRGGRKVDAYTHYTDWADVIMAGYTEDQQTGYPERFMTKFEYYGKEFKFGRKVISLSQIFHDLDGFPTKRGQKDWPSVEYAASLLSQGHIVAIAPQGESVKDKASRPKLKKGVGLIAILGNAPIQPKAIVGQTRRIPFAGKEFDWEFDRMGINKVLHLKVPNLSFTRRFVVRFGEPIELPPAAADYKIENLDRSVNEETGQSEIVIPRDLLKLAIEIGSRFAPRFYANYETALQDFKEIYGRAA